MKVKQRHQPILSDERQCVNCAHAHRIDETTLECDAEVFDTRFLTCFVAADTCKSVDSPETTSQHSECIFHFGDCQCSYAWSTYADSREQADFCLEEPCRFEVCAGELMSFGLAIEAVKNGRKVAREGWNGKKQYVQLATCVSYKTPSGEIVNADHDAIGNQALAFVGTSGVQLGWLASQADMLAEDWFVVEE